MPRWLSLQLQIRYSYFRLKPSLKLVRKARAAYPACGSSTLPLAPPTQLLGLPSKEDTFVPPFNLHVEKAGAKLLVDMAKIGAHYPHTSLVSSRRYLRSSNDTVRKYLTAYAYGVRRLVEDPGFSKAVLSRYTKTTQPEFLDAMYRFGLDFIEKIPYPSREAILETIWESEHPGAKNAKPEEFIDDQIVRDLEREGYFSGRGKK